MRATLDGRPWLGHRRPGLMPSFWPTDDALADFLSVWQIEAKASATAGEFPGVAEEFASCRVRTPEFRARVRAVQFAEWLEDQRIKTAKKQRPESLREFWAMRVDR